METKETKIILTFDLTIFWGGIVIKKMFYKAVTGVLYVCYKNFPESLLVFLLRELALIRIMTRITGSQALHYC